MILTLLACVLTGLAIAAPIIRANRRASEARLVIRRNDYLRTRRVTRLSRVAANTFGVRS